MSTETIARAETDGKVARTCGRCAVQFLAYRSHVKKGGGRYCSKTCYHASQTKPADERAVEPRSCQHCGIEFLARTCEVRKGWGKFCSRRCRSRHPKKGGLPRHFWSKVDKNGPVPSHRPELGRCWLWTGGTSPLGYGRIRVSAPRRVELAHRLSYAMKHGPVPEGLFVCHHCDNPACVNPEHLFVGTHEENMQDMVAKGRNVGSRGHRLLDEERVREIKLMLRDTGMPHKEVAARFGVSRQLIDSISRGALWSRVKV